MNKLTVFIGDIADSVMHAATQFDPAAFLVDSSNYKELLNQELKFNTTIYTSLGDLPKDLSIAYDILDAASNIYYVNNTTKWSDNQPVNVDNVTDSMQGLTEGILFYFKHAKNNVHGLNLEKYNTEKYTKIIEQRKTQDQQLWVAGCSFTYGVGVLPEQSYGYLLGQKLNLPTTILAAPGGSNEWAVDQLLRSDIQPGDIVVLGLTSTYRFSHWDDIDQCVTHVTPGESDFVISGFSKSTIKEIITSEHCTYQTFIHLEQLKNFCQKIQANLLIVGLLNTTDTYIKLHNYQELAVYNNFKHQLNMLESYADIGTDGIHPGPRQHILYADFCLDQLKTRNYI